MGIRDVLAVPNPGRIKQVQFPVQFWEGGFA